MELFLNDKLGKISYDIDQAVNADQAPVLLLAHGAGAGKDHPFMVKLSESMAAQGIHTVRFNFPYKEQGRKAPGSPKQAIDTWHYMIEKIDRQYPDNQLFISGKSYGGRMASHYLAQFSENRIKGIVYFGFPLHAPGRESTDRADHLQHLSIPQLFIQGTRDQLANIDLIKQVVEGQHNASLFEVEFGDHSFNVPKKIGSSEDTLKRICDHASRWIQAK